MMYKDTIAFLSQQACPSIQARIHREFWHELDYPYQDEILADPLVQTAFSWSGNGRWENTIFHGYESMEAAIRILIEKGLNPNHAIIQSALNKLEQDSEYIYRGIGKPGRWLDEAGLGGSKIIRAYLFAKAGQPTHPFVTDEMPLVIDQFRSVLTWENYGQAAQLIKGKYVYQPGTVWPSIYHLRLLTYTTQWRNSQNMQLLQQVIQKLIDFSPMPPTYLKIKSQLVAPAGFAMADFNPKFENLSPFEWMQTIHRLELLARLGFFFTNPTLKQQRDWLDNHLQQNKGWSNLNLNHSSFKKWGAYTGIQLEKDWRSAERRRFDLTFRILLILNHEQNFV